VGAALADTQNVVVVILSQSTSPKQGF
jgi:hypothetical protein